MDPNQLPVKGLSFKNCLVDSICEGLVICVVSAGNNAAMVGIDFMEPEKILYPLKAGWNCIAEVLFGGEKMPIDKAFGAAEEDFGSTFTMPF